MQTRRAKLIEQRLLEAKRIHARKKLSSTEKDRLRLYYKDFATITMRCPSTREQRKIANFFSSLDERIRIQAGKIEALKEHKKGLLQQLFPAMDEAGA